MSWRQDGGVAPFLLHKCVVDNDRMRGIINKMKTISIRTDFAYAVAYGIKVEEYRTWPTDVRGTVLIHASGADSEIMSVSDSRYDPNALAIKTEQREDGGYDFVGLDDGIDEAEARSVIDAHLDAWGKAGDVVLRGKAIIGTVDIVGCKKTGDGYAWALKNPRVFEKPITGISGKLRFWEYKGKLPERM